MKKLVLILFCMLMISSISAVWWNPFTWFGDDDKDEVIKQFISDENYRESLRETTVLRESNEDKYKSYYSDEKKLVIENDKYEKQLELKLDSPYIVEGLIASSDTKVAEFTLIDYAKEGNLFENINSYNINNNYDTLNKNFWFKYEKETEYCDDSKNGTKICVINKEWIRFNEMNELPSKNIKLGLFTDTQTGEYIEWIPTIEGFEILEWASYRVTGATYLRNVSISGTPAGSDIKPDGTKFYWIDRAGDRINEWNITDTWNISSAVASSTFGGLQGVNDVRGLEILPTGTTYFTTSTGTVKNLTKWTMGTAWLVNTTTIDSSIKISDYNCSTPMELEWSEDGSILFCVDNDDDAIEIINASSNWSLSNPAWSCRFDVSGYDSDIGDIDFSENGTIMHIMGNANNSLFEFNVSNGYNICADATYSTNYSMPTDNDFLMQTISWGNNGESFYDTREGDDTILEYSLESSPLVTLSNPPSNNYTISNIVTFNCSAIDSSQVDNITLFIDGNANATETGSSPSISLGKELEIEWGIHTWGCNATDNNGNIGSATERTLNIGFIEESQTYNSETTEGSKELFNVNISFNSSEYTSTKASLFYNQTNYQGIQTIYGNIVSFNRTLAIPNVDVKTNLTFYWQIGLYNGSWEYYNLTAYNQTVNNIGIDNCSNYSTVIYNYTVYDEGNQSKLINTTIEIQINMYDSSRTVNFLNYSEKYESTNPARICFNGTLLETVNYSVDSIIKYTANETNTSYAQEHYHLLNDIITNTTIPKNIKLYSLKSDDSTEFQLTFRDSSYSLASGILVKLYRQYVEDNDFKIVEIPLTDSNGQTILHMVRNDVVYNLIMVDSEGNILATFNKIIAFCQDYTIGQCTINLNAKGSEDEIYNSDEVFGVSYSKPTYSNSTKLVSFSFATDDQESKTISMEVIRNNQFGNRSVCTNSLTSASGILSCDVSDISENDRILFVYINVDGDLMVMDSIDLEGESSGFGTVTGAFFSFLLILLLITMFSDDKQVLVLSLLIGWVIVIGIGGMSGALFGTLAGGVWLLISGIIFLWKLNKEDER